jgi:hypothetical protein
MLHWYRMQGRKERANVVAKTQHETDHCSERLGNRGK